MGRPAPQRVGVRRFTKRQGLWVVALDFSTDARLPSQNSMKRYPAVVAICLVAVVLFLVLRNLGGPEKVAAPETLPAGSRTSDRRMGLESDPPPNRRDAVGDTLLGAGRRELPGVASSVQRQPGSGGADVFGVRIDAEIREGETLVTGGNLGPDGSHEFTMITPVAVQLPDGQDAIRVDMKVVSAGPEFIDDNGLQSIGGNAQSALQVAEAWRSATADQIVESASQELGSAMMMAPTVLAVPGEPFSIEVRDADGSGYRLNGTFSAGDSGGFRVRSQLDRALPSSDSE